MISIAHIGRIKIVSSALFLALMVAEVLAITWKCQGHFIYTLDDPYIHLNVADRILHGGYGINVGEYASPSSSAIWPWLLAVGLAFGGGSLVPLALAGAMAWLALLVLADIAATLLPETERLGWAGSAAVAILLILISSAVALPLTGLEHSLHILATVLTLRGLIAISKAERPTWSFWAGLALMPFARFEGCALAGASLVILLFTRERRGAVLAGLAIACGLAAYMVFMAAHHLPLVPTSITLKADQASNGHGVLRSILFDHILGNTLQTSQAPILEVESAICLYALWKTAKSPGPSIVLGPIAAATLAHVAVGAYGWFGRYEVYAMVIGGVGLVYAYSLARDGLFTSPIPAKVYALAAGLLLICACPPYLATLVGSPAAAASIYDQQYQMRRFAQDAYRAAVGVNDIGLVGYRNPAYVLDLYGLGSTDVARLKAAKRYTTAQMARLVDAHDVGLVMIYPDWLPKTPTTWTPTATLITPAGSAAEPRVAFFVTDRGDAARVRQMLVSFAASLPPGDRLEIDWSPSLRAYPVRPQPPEASITWPVTQPAASLAK